MKLYNNLIQEIPGLLAGVTPQIYPYTVDKTWPESDDFELIFQKDMAYELGGPGKEAAQYTCVTTDREVLDGDSICVYGPELAEIAGDTSYARIVVVVAEDNADWEDSEKLYHAMQDMDFVKYHVFPKGFMLRNSGQTNREQVRVGKKELQAGMTFERIGNTIIGHYRELPGVLAVQVIFVTSDRADFAGLGRAACKATEIRRSLSEIKKGLPTECSECGIREICNEVEGLRELHFGQDKARPKPQVRI